MNPESLEFAKLEVLSDAIKIGIPALVGIFTGLIPYFFERKKSIILLEREAIASRRENALLLIEKLAIFTKGVDRYVADVCLDLNQNRIDRLKVHKKSLRSRVKINSLF